MYITGTARAFQSLGLTKTAAKTVGYVGPIQKQTEDNTYFRKVLFTGKHAQLVLMSIDDEIGEETHDAVDQFFRIDGGQGAVTMNGVRTPVKDGDAFIVPAGTKHNIVNTSKTEPLKLYSVYSPPNHPPGTIHKTKAEAIAAEKAGKDKKPSTASIVPGALKMANGDDEEEDAPNAGKKIPNNVIVKFFKDNPNPDDEQVHELAESYGTDPHTVENQIYATLTDAMRRR